MIHRVLVPILAAAALAMAGCGSTATTPQQALGGDAAAPATHGAAKTVNGEPDHWAGVTNPTANASPATAPLPISAPRLDVSSPQRMAESLRAIDASLDPGRKKLLRGSLSVFTLQMQAKVTQIAQTYPKEHPPQFTDEQLLQMAYGQLNGMNADQIIQAGHELAQQFPPGYFSQQGADPATAMAAPAAPSP